MKATKRNPKNGRLSAIQILVHLNGLPFWFSDKSSICNYIGWTLLTNDFSFIQISFFPPCLSARLFALFLAHFHSTDTIHQRIKYYQEKASLSLTGSSLRNNCVSDFILDIVGDRNNQCIFIYGILLLREGKKVKAAAEHVNELLQSKLKILHGSTTLYNRGSKNVNSYGKKVLPSGK